jgi:hypothetical protein
MGPDTVPFTAKETVPESGQLNRASSRPRSEVGQGAMTGSPVRMSNRCAPASLLVASVAVPLLLVGLLRSLFLPRGRLGLGLPFSEQGQSSIQELRVDPEPHPLEPLEFVFEADKLPLSGGFEDADGSGDREPSVTFPGLRPEKRRIVIR